MLGGKQRTSRSFERRRCHKNSTRRKPNGERRARRHASVQAQSMRQALCGSSCFYNPAPNNMDNSRFLLLNARIGQNNGERSSGFCCCYFRKLFSKNIKKTFFEILYNQSFVLFLCAVL